MQLVPEVAAEHEEARHEEEIAADIEPQWIGHEGRGEVAGVSFDPVLDEGYAKHDETDAMAHGADGARRCKSLYAPEKLALEVIKPRLTEDGYGRHHQ